MIGPRLVKDLAETAGYFEGQNGVIDYHWTEGQNARLAGLGIGPALAADLVRLKVAAIYASNTIAANVRF